MPLSRDIGPSAIRDDTTYLFLEDRQAGQSGAAGTEDVAASAGNVGAGASNANGGQASSTAATINGGANAQSSTTNNETDLEMDGFEIIQLPPDTPAATTPSLPTQPNQPTTTTQPLVPSAPKAALHPTSKGKRGTYRILAVRPASNVLLLLQSLLSPFVVGLTKSARAAASTTAQSATPTPLAGTPFLVTSLTFPPLAPPMPQIVLTVHNLSSAASTTIFVEGELVGAHDPQLAREILRECLDECVPDGLGGTKVFHEWEGAEADSWESTEKEKRMTMLLARCLREASYI